MGRDPAWGCTCPKFLSGLVSPLCPEHGDKGAMRADIEARAERAKELGRRIADLTAERDGLAEQVRELREERDALHEGSKRVRDAVEALHKRLDDALANRAEGNQ